MVFKLSKAVEPKSTSISMNWQLRVNACQESPAKSKKKTTWKVVRQKMIWGPIDFLVIKENIKKLLHVYHIHKTFTFLEKKAVSIL